MQLRRRSVQRVLAQGRAASPRLGVALLMGLALAFLVLSKVHEDKAGLLRSAVSDLLVPVMSALSRPVETLNRIGDKAGQFWATYEENQRLRREVARLSQWRAAAYELERVNAALGAQLNIQAEGQPAFTTARVVADSGSPFVRTLLLGAGADAGIRRLQAAVSGEGLVGRVAEVGRRSSRLLLITDLNSRVPVLIQSSGQRAILTGDNSDLPRLEFLATGATVRSGDRIVTSGHGGVFPPGLAVGVVTSISDDGVRIRPFVDWGRLSHVTVVKYTAPEPLPPRRRSAERGVGL